VAEAKNEPSSSKGTDTNAPARALVANVVAGRVTQSDLDALADAVLNEERAQLALEVRAGGPDAVRRAIELAALVLAASATIGGASEVAK